MLLRITGVAKYWQAVRNRCLLWHQGQLVPLQSNGLVHLNHGDTTRVAVPPFPAPEVSMYYAVRACQHGLTPMEITHRYRNNPDPDDLFTDLEPEQHDAQVGIQLVTQMLPHRVCGPIRWYEGQDQPGPQFNTKAENFHSVKMRYLGRPRMAFSLSMPPLLVKKKAHCLPQRLVCTRIMGADH